MSDLRNLAIRKAALNGHSRSSIKIFRTTK